MKKKRGLLAFMLTCGALASVSLTSCGGTKEVDPIDDNYRVMYEIFSGSYSDSNGDGLGDLKGIQNRLDYLNDGNINSTKSLGIQGIWLTPIFKSPSYHKYDVSDYYTLDDQFGTDEDLENLIKDCHSRNVILVLDLVINHTSTSHPWFLKFQSAHQAGNTEDPYYNFYTYSDEKKPGYSLIRNTNQYYECNFDTGMPELNYDNPAVYEEMIKVAKYWLDKGVDGFRFDAARYIYYGNTAQNVQFWQKYCDELRAYKPNVYMIGEVLNAGVLEEVQYSPAINTFSFEFSGAEGLIARGANGSATYGYVVNTVANLKDYKAANQNAMMSAVISNHDMNRLAGSLSPTNGNAQMAANLLLFTQGSPFIYYGEEICMKGTRDGNTDANRRLAMNWGDGDTVKDPVGATGAEHTNGTVKQQKKDKKSLLNYYKKVIRIRNKHPEIARGDYAVLKLKEGGSSRGGFKITYGESTIALIHNCGKEAYTVNLSDLDGDFTKILDSVGMNNCSIKDGVLTVGAQTSVILG